MSGDGPNQKCPCHSGKKYKKCCRPYHTGDAAPTPEALMRSRYAAYALGLVDYVMDTQVPDGPRARLDRGLWASEIAEFGRRTRFEGLVILGTGSEGDAGWVHFRATLLEGAEDVSFEERSGFTRAAGRWLYASGTRVKPRIV